MQENSGVKMFRGVVDDEINEDDESARDMVYMTWDVDEVPVPLLNVNARQDFLEKAATV